MPRILPLISSLLLSTMAASAADVYVSPNGNNQASGSREAPFKTLSQALKTLRPGDVCHVMPGIYEECIESMPNGEPGRPITLKSEVPQGASLTGLTRITTPWTRHRGDVWKTVVPATLPNRNQLFVEGEPAVRCRWPKRVSKDWLNWDGADYVAARSNQEKLVCETLPDRPDGYWNGATLWVMGGCKWTSWSAKITGYDQATKTLTYATGNRSRIGSGRFMSLDLPQGGYFVLLADERELSQPNEFYVDDATRTVYLQVPAGTDPNSMDIRLQTRLNTIQLKNAKHICIDGFKSIGGMLSVTGDSEDCTLQNLRCSWIGALDGGDTGYELGVEIGVILSGKHLVIRDSEIAYSHGNGISLSGTDGAVINCHIHDIDFLGSYDTPVQLRGSRHLLSHCTIHDTGRDCVHPNSTESVIQYNNIYNMGRICHDLGATYVCQFNGGGTEYHHNWVHDNLAHGTRMGIYLDNFTCNNFVYKNVVWNIGGCDIRLNRPSHNNFVINNTMLGKCGNWGRWETDWMYNCAYINNAVAGVIASHPQPALLHNTFNIPTSVLSIEQFMNYPDGAGKGFAIPGITGDHPSIGAYEPGETWRPGHDFTQHPMPEYKLLDTPLRNLIVNSTFVSRGNTQSPWQLLGKASVISTAGGILVCYTEREAIIDRAISLNDDGDAIEQSLKGARVGQPYQFCGWYKLAKDDLNTAEAVFYVKENGTITAQTTLKADNVWHLATLAHTPKSADVTVGVVKHGAGVVRVDSLSYAGIVPGMEPKLPGYAPVAPKPPAPKPAPRRTAPLIIPTGKVVTDIINQAPGRRLAAGKPAQATFSHADGTLSVTVTVPLNKQPEAVASPQWNVDDGVELCLSFAEYNAQQTVHILHGFVNGDYEASSEAGATADDCARLKACTTFKATRANDGWTATWTVRLKDAGLPAIPGTVYDFNIGIYRKESKQWLQWAGTPSQTWLVKEAAQIRLE